MESPQKPRLGYSLSQLNTIYDPIVRILRARYLTALFTDEQILQLDDLRIHLEQRIQDARDEQDSDRQRRGPT